MYHHPSKSMPLEYSTLYSWKMGEKDDDKCSQAGQLFENFVQASTCKGTIQAFNILTRQLELDPLDSRNFYTKLKSKVTSWKAKALWNKLDKRANHKEYKRGKSCIGCKVRQKDDPLQKSDPCFFSSGAPAVNCLDYKYLQCELGVGRSSQCRCLEFAAILNFLSCWKNPWFSGCACCTPVMCRKTIRNPISTF